MFKKIAASTYFIASIATFIPEELAYRKEQRARRIEGELYEQMIAESQAKLAETTLVPGYRTIYA